MSSTTTEVIRTTKTMDQVSSPAPTSPVKLLTRSTSLEKIKYFCSQQYYLVPTMLACLKSSHSLLHATAGALSVRPRDSLRAVYARAQRLNWLAVAMVTLCAVLGAQLAYCVYVITWCGVPNGLAFLAACWMYIIYLTYRCSFFYKDVRGRNKKTRESRSRSKKNE